MGYKGMKSDHLCNEHEKVQIAASVGGSPIDTSQANFYSIGLMFKLNLSKLVAHDLWSGGSVEVVSLFFFFFFFFFFHT